MMTPLPAQVPQPTPQIPQQPPQAMFPAYENKSNPVDVANTKPADVPSTSATAAGAVKSLSSRTRIVCPDENVSLVSSLFCFVKKLWYSRIICICFIYFHF
jgi:hypothetical protein